MTTPGSWAARVALWLIGVVFLVKYGARALEPAWLAAGVAAYSALWFALPPLARRLPPRLPGPAAGAALLAATALCLVSPLENNVTRLPALGVWLDRLAAGTFPYGLPVRPSGFPGLFAGAAPFWALGLLRLLPAVGLAVWLAVVWRRAPQPASRAGLLAAVLLLPSFHYEVWVHSELFLNAALALAALPLFLRARESSPALLAGLAVAVGLLLSTRLVVGAAFAVYGAYAFRDRWGRGAAFAGVALAAWALTLAPFVWWDPEAFRTYGPFAVQGIYLPRWALVLGVAAALGLGWTAHTADAVVRRTGWVLAALAGLSFALTAAEAGVGAAVTERFDLAYFALATPFLLLTAWAPSGEAPSRPGPRARPDA